MIFTLQWCEYYNSGVEDIKVFDIIFNYDEEYSSGESISSATGDFWGDIDFDPHDKIINIILD